MKIRESHGRVGLWFREGGGESRRERAHYALMLTGVVGNGRASEMEHKFLVERELAHSNTDKPNRIYYTLR